MERVLKYDKVFLSRRILSVTKLNINLRRQVGRVLKILQNKTDTEVNDSYSTCTTRNRAAFYHYHFTWDFSRRQRSSQIAKETCFFSNWWLAKRVHWTATFTTFLVGILYWRMKWRVTADLLIPSSTKRDTRLQNYDEIKNTTIKLRRLQNYNEMKNTTTKLLRNEEYDNKITMKWRMLLKNYD